MVITRTPYRISFFGGGSDYPSWYLQNNGQVLSTTIDKHVYVSCRYLPPFSESLLSVTYSKIEEVQHVNELEHPTAREVLKHFNIERGVGIYYAGDLPARSGMGSSSAFTVGMLNALYKYQGIEVSAERLALESICIEQQRIGEVVGSQDQVSAAHGGFNRIRFFSSGKIKVEPVIAESERIRTLESRLMLFFTGIKRTANDVAKSYAENPIEKRQQFFNIASLVDEACELLESTSAFDEFGQLLHRAWLEKRQLSNLVSNTYIDEIYEEAIAAGAIGGKLCGAGAGGFMLFYVPTNKQNNVRKKLSRLIHVPFTFEPNGSEIIFSSPQKRYTKEESERLLTNQTGFSEFVS